MKAGKHKYGLIKTHRDELRYKSIKLGDKSNKGNSQIISNVKRTEWKNREHIHQENENKRQAPAEYDSYLCIWSNTESKSLTNK